MEPDDKQDPHDNGSEMEEDDFDDNEQKDGEGDEDDEPLGEEDDGAEAEGDGQEGDEEDGEEDEEEKEEAEVDGHEDDDEEGEEAVVGEDGGDSAGEQVLAETEYATLIEAVAEDEEEEIGEDGTFEEVEEGDVDEAEEGDVEEAEERDSEAEEGDTEEVEEGDAEEVEEGDVEDVEEAEETEEGDVEEVEERDFEQAEEDDAGDFTEAIEEDDGGVVEEDDGQGEEGHGAVDDGKGAGGIVGRDEGEEEDADEDEREEEETAGVLLVEGGERNMEDPPPVVLSSGSADETMCVELSNDNLDPVDSGQAPLVSPSETFTEASITLPVDEISVSVENTADEMVVDLPSSNVNESENDKTTTQSLTESNEPPSTLDDETRLDEFPGKNITQFSNDNEVPEKAQGNEVTTNASPKVPNQSLTDEEESGQCHNAVCELENPKPLEDFIEEMVDAQAAPAEHMDDDAIHAVSEQEKLPAKKDLESRFLSTDHTTIACAGLEPLTVPPEPRRGDGGLAGNHAEFDNDRSIATPQFIDSAAASFQEFAVETEAATSLKDSAMETDASTRFEEKAVEINASTSFEDNANDAIGFKEGDSVTSHKKATGVDLSVKENIVVNSANDIVTTVQAPLSPNEFAMGDSVTRFQEKTELEREMELYEAAERDTEARMLVSKRAEQTMQETVPEVKMQDSPNDKKRSLDSSPPNEGRRKRGKRVQSADASGKNEEDVCFICFDGGDLVLCDRRTCPKAYHLNCIGRDTAFFQKKGAWICGWHFCSVCTKPANFQCYTCPTAYCNACLKKADFLCIRQRKGLCEECLPIVNMIEHHESTNAEGVEVDFSDPDTYECLFKEYWEDLKQKLSLDLAEMGKDGKMAGGSGGDQENGDSEAEDKADIDEYSTESDKIPEEADEDAAMGDDVKKRKRGKTKAVKNENEGDLVSDTEIEEEDVEGNPEEDADEELEDAEENEKPDMRPREFEGWASKELADFIKFMNEDAKKPLSRFQVTKLLWAYIKKHKLQDPRKKSQIRCDDRLRTIFGKKSVGQFEMFKHLQVHFAPKGPRKSGRQSRDDQPGAEEEQTEGEAEDRGIKGMKDKRRRRKLDEDKFERPNVNEYAAVTPKNINLIYLRRALLEELLDDSDFDNKVLNTFVRIRVPGMVSKSEMCYRLVQVVGTRLQAEHYKAGRKTSNVVLEILNLQKREDVTVDLVSNHDFTEEECQRLRQSMRCGFIKALTVGQIEEKARALQEAKVNDWFETERQRLVNLRDRASEKGRKKELRECVEKLQELSSPAFRAAKLQARPEVTSDPRMDPSYESDGSEEKNSTSESGSGEKISLANARDRTTVDDTSWHGQRQKQLSWEELRSREWERGYEPVRANKESAYGRTQNYGMDDANLRSADDRSWDKEWKDQEREQGGDAGWRGNGRNRPLPGEKWNEKVDSKVGVDARPTRVEYRLGASVNTPMFDVKSDWTGRKEQSSLSLQHGLTAVASGAMNQAAVEAAEKEKVWHYLDPTNTVQGPFSMEQLRKWNTTGLFPLDLRIWRTNQPREESVLLTDGLAGRVAKEVDPWRTAPRPNNFMNLGLQDDSQILPQPVGTGFRTVDNFGSSLSVVKSADGWRENGGSGSWTERGPGDVGRAPMWNTDGGQSSRTGSNQLAADRSSWNSYGRSTYSTSPTRSAKLDGAMPRLDPSGKSIPDWGGWNSSVPGKPDSAWSSRPDGVRPEKDGLVSPTPMNDAGFAKGGGRGSWGGVSQVGGAWNPGTDVTGHDSSRSSKVLRGSRKDVPCRFYQKGYCKRGEGCDFWHG